MVVGCAVLAYAVIAGVSDHDEPLIGVFIALIVIPAILLTTLGYFMRQGKLWAALLLRVSIGGILLGGAVLDLAMGLDVFSLPQLAIPVILGSIAWLVLS